MNTQSPPPIVADRWQELMDDAEATEAEYNEEGYRTLLVHTGDVTPLTDVPFGLDVLAPGDEFEALESLVEEATFDTSHVYRNEEGGARFLIVVVEGTDADGEDVAVVVPAFLDIAGSEPLEERATDAGVMYTHVRPLSDDSRVTFTHEDPGLFF
ncbi:DUF7529 family protein [Natronomonas sp.]|uniref:DUF7529 family protein n=1 Tax=Natronomonas sp. TaxID=2184060 RepID=UPI002FC2C610